MIHLHLGPLGLDTLLCPSHGSIAIILERLEELHNVLMYTTFFQRFFIFDFGLCMNSLWVVFMEVFFQARCSKPSRRFGSFFKN
jgi:hypothetical protein